MREWKGTKRPFPDLSKCRPGMHFNEIPISDKSSADQIFVNTKKGIIRPEELYVEIMRGEGATAAYSVEHWGKKKSDFSKKVFDLMHCVVDKSNDGEVFDLISRYIAKCQEENPQSIGGGFPDVVAYFDDKIIFSEIKIFDGSLRLHDSQTKSADNLRAIVDGEVEFRIVYWLGDVDEKLEKKEHF